MHSIILFASLLASLVISTNVESPILPSQDPFYVQPANISLYQPGDVIRTRPIGNIIQGNSPLPPFTVKSANQFMYRTTDSLNNPVAAIMTFLAPNGTNANSNNLLAYSTAYDSANNDCSPSYSLQAGANNSVGADATLIQAALSNGWYVVNSDYEGLSAQFVAGVQAGHAVLDSIRASFNTSALALTGLSPHANYAMFGYSGGSLASEFAAELAPTYAPDLTRFVGSAIGGLTPNVTNVLLTINKTPAVGLAFAGVHGLSKAYANLSTYIDSQLVPSKKAEFYTLATECNSQYIAAASFQDFFSYFTNGTNIMNSEVWQTITSGAGQQGVYGIPNQPLFVYKAVGDEVSPVADTDELVSRYCSDGVSVQYQKNLFGGHITEAVLGSPAAFEWLRDRFEGKKIAQVDNLQSCQVQDVFIVSTDDTGAEGIFGQGLASELEVELKASNGTAV